MRHGDVSFGVLTASSNRDNVIEMQIFAFNLALTEMTSHAISPCDPVVINRLDDGSVHAATPTSLRGFYFCASNRNIGVVLCLGPLSSVGSHLCDVLRPTLLIRLSAAITVSVLERL